MNTVLIGSAGALLLLLAFGLEKFGVLHNESLPYNGLNLMGAALLTWYAAVLVSWPFIILEGIWALIAAWYVLKRLAGSPENR